MMESVALAPRSSRRRLPKQDRARATVDAILAAAVQVFLADGYPNATTARIAEVAGVSIGSFYQYFPNKEALVAALGEREMQRMTDLLAGQLARAQKSKPRTVIRKCIKAVLDYYEEDAALQRVLVEHVPHVSGLQRIHVLDMNVVDIVRGYFEGHIGSRRKNAHVAYFVVMHAVRAVAFGYLFQRPAGLDTETLADELTDLVAPYLLPARA
jgi:AcrR family transcriptional regulator